MKLYTEYEELRLKELGITERNPFKLISILIRMITELQRRMNNG